MDAFHLREEIINQYKSYVTSFINIRDSRINNEVKSTVRKGLLWPDPLVQINPKFEPGESVSDFIKEGILHPECEKIFAVKKEGSLPNPLRLYRHQAEAIKIANQCGNYVLTTGTGSGKSLSYIIPIVNFALKSKEQKGIKAIIVYPLNALANSQIEELKRFVNKGYSNEKGPVTFRRYTGQESEEEKQEIRANPPDILLTNYVMLELILTRPEEKVIIRNAQGLRFLVLDELHTYRGRQGADVAMLVRRAKNYFKAENLICVGTSATMAGEGSREESNAQVAEVASKLFGSEVKPENIIGESLTRVTEPCDPNSADFMQKLKKRLREDDVPSQLEEFKRDPLAQWAENTFGVETDEGGQLKRAVPKPVRGEKGVAVKLAAQFSLEKDRTESRIRAILDAGNTIRSEDSESKPCFAYRLHQFISPSETVFTTLEDPDRRKITLSGQYYSPSDPDKILYPMAFCRECGQEFYSVRHDIESDTIEPREFHDRQKTNENGNDGYLYLNLDNPWPDNEAEALGRIPEDWLEEKGGKTFLPKSRRSWVPKTMKLDPTGVESEKGLPFAFIRTPFRFCPNCGVVYATQQRSDFGKLASLGTEGRSTATTILSLGAIAELLNDKSLDKEARKLLSFTDNRQDASLQAGHFNDFIHMGILRAGIYKAVERAGEEGLDHEKLIGSVFDAMNIPFPEYSQSPDLLPIARSDVNKAFRGTLGYRIYSDLRGGWRINVPNLEQVGLLRIEYKYLDQIAKSNDYWAGCHEALAMASPETRRSIVKTLLDYMRRELALKVEYLEHDYQETLLRTSNQLLKDPWAMDEDDKPIYSSILFPCSRPTDETGIGSTKKYRYMSARGGMGRYLKRDSTLPGFSEKLTLDDIDQMIRDLLEVLRQCGIVEQIPAGRGGQPGFRLKAASLVWKKGDGTPPPPDPIRVVKESEYSRDTNEYFKRYYIDVGNRIPDIKAAEHTAQVNSAIRVQREEDFREAKLPVLYCSPTMELGVDIAQLNVVNMRNVPPNPANYAQRSGRAGRSGQPALVFTYCGKSRPHDQYFFRRPEDMVAGAVTPPRIDMVNEELILSHLHSIWLAETGVKLGKSLKDLLDLSEKRPELHLHIQDELSRPDAVARTIKRVEEIYKDIMGDLKEAYWFDENWFETQLNRVMDRFVQAMERWIYLYTSAVSQMGQQHNIQMDVSREKKQRERAGIRYNEAKRQRDLLLNENFDLGSDFYSYRYFASEGFLPGYNFPRLPLNAYIPGRRRSSEGEYLSRSRFLAISEFGPRSMIYHEGAKYEIDRVIFQVDGTELTTGEIKICEACGYLHEIKEQPGPDLCENCSTELPVPMTNMFRLRNVSTRRRERISTDEEERMRYGFDIRTAVRFARTSKGSETRTSTVEDANGNALLKMKYGPAATIWRINQGWKRRKDQHKYGFILDIEKGRWEKQDKEETNTDNPSAALTKRVVPYVEDTKNCLIIEPANQLTDEQFFSFIAALKNSIQVVYKIEDRELAAEALPTKNEPRSILLYEASEGGAGVLERILSEESSIRRIAAEALMICHFDPDTGENQANEEECSKACYSCLMSYYNQSEHKLLNRNSIKELLQSLKNSTHKISPTQITREEHLKMLKALCESDLEREWLDFLEENNLKLPDRAQVLIKEANTRVDFLYEKDYIAVFIDGPHHDNEKVKRDDEEKRAKLEEMGFEIIVVSYKSFNSRSYPELKI